MVIGGLITSGEEVSMNDGFECAFGTEYRKWQHLFCWKFSCLLLLCVTALTLLKIYWLQGGVWRLIDLVLPGIILLCSLYFIALNLGIQHWMARQFKFSNQGIVMSGRRKNEETIPWSAVVAVDTGTLTGYENHSVPVIRCFLTSSAWEKFTPNLRQSTEKNSMQHYFKLRKECFAIEYSPKREQTILSLWAHSGADERDKPIDGSGAQLVSDKEFQNAFSEDISIFDSSFVFMNYFLGGIGVLGLLVPWFLNKHDETTLRNTLILLVFILILLVIINSGRKTTTWLKSKTKICRDGIYIKEPKEKERFIPWDSIVEIERRLMIVGRNNNASVICCFQNFSSQSRLYFEAKKNNQGQDLQMYYSLRNEIVTMSYTKERMAKIRAFHRAATKKK